MMKLVISVVAILVMGVAYFIGEPGLKTRVANLSCNDFMALKPVSLEALRGRLAMVVRGGDMEMLAENCAVYQGKPMGIYFGWHDYLQRS